MKRRQFIATLAGAATAWPLAARAQQAAMPVIGMLMVGAPDAWNLSDFRKGLADAGYVEGRTLVIEYRYASGDVGRLPELAADLIRRGVAVIIPLASGVAAVAAKRATGTIPVVFGYGGDPVAAGLVGSFNRPGGNVTGLTSLATALVSKELEILHELLPHAARFGLLGDPRSASYASYVKEAQGASPAIGVTIEVLTASTVGEIDAVFARLADARRLQGLIAANEVLFVSQRRRLAEAAARSAIPAIYPFREHAEAGDLISYGPDLAERDREVGHYVGRILRGEKPGDLPVVQSAKFELVLNMRSAKALGLAIPDSLQLRADAVIE